jgi:hypothetical protein
LACWASDLMWRKRLTWKKGQQQSVYDILYCEP